MSDYIKQADIPVKETLAEALGFDADGNWAKMAPANPADVQAAKTAAENAEALATPLANLGGQGRVASHPFSYLAGMISPGLSNLEDIFKVGALGFKDGYGVPFGRVLTKFDFHLKLDTARALNYGIPFILSGTMGVGSQGFDYNGGYAKRNVLGIMFLVGGFALVFDLTYGEVWTRLLGDGSDYSEWRQIGGGSDSGGSDYTLPVATTSALGGIKSSDTVKVGNDGVASVPTATKTQAGVVKVGSGLVMGSDGTLSIGNNSLAEITDDLIKQRFSEAYVAYNNSAPANEVAAVSGVLNYDGTDKLTLAVKYLLQFFRLSFVQYPSEVQPWSGND